MMRRPSWIAFTVLVLILAVTFVQLGRWQLHRHDERAALNGRVAASVDRPAVPVDDLLTAGAPPPPGTEWRQVEAVGTYDVDGELLVRNQQFEGGAGYGVITPLVTTDGTILLIDRGWVPSGETATDQPVVPPPPAGEVAVTARVRLGATGDPGAQGLPPSQVRRVVVADIAAAASAPVYGAYATLLPGEPGTGTADEPPRVVVPPETSSGPHLAYGVQWFLFVLIAVAGWIVLLRGEIRAAAAPVRPRPRAGAEQPRVRT